MTATAAGAGFEESAVRRDAGAAASVMDRPVQLSRWDLDVLMARGGMAELWLARERGSEGRRVVVKRMLREHGDEPHLATMFREEARLGRLLQHGAIARLLDVGDDQGEPFLVLEHVEGTNLRAALATMRHWALDMPPAVAVHVAREVLRALSYAHAAVDEHGLPLGVVHRDVSPGNVLLSTGGEVKLCDFGVAKTGANRTAGRWLKGKARYMAPEQTRCEPVDGQADQFAVGAVLWEMLTGQPRFRAGSVEATFALVRAGGIPEEVPLGVPGEARLRRILERALAASAPERFPSAEAFAAELWGWLVDVGAPDPVPMLRDFVRRSLDPLGAALCERSSDPVKATVPRTPRPRPAASGEHGVGDQASLEADSTLAEPTATTSAVREPGRWPRRSVAFLVVLADAALAVLLAWSLS